MRETKSEIKKVFDKHQYSIDSNCIRCHADLQAEFHRRPHEI